jgi:MFS family permease
MLTGLASSFWELVVIRFLLGLAEGPIYITTSMFLSHWFMKSERGRAFGIWNLAVPAGAFLAGPISGAILANYNWRVMMLAEGMPAWLFCIIWFLVIPRDLQSARWLDQSDREIIQQTLAAEQAAYQESDMDPWWTILSEKAVWLLTLGFGFNNVLLYGTTLWLPTVMKSYGRLGDVMIGFFSGAPFVMSMFGIYYITNRSDKHGQERRLHAAVPTMLTGALMIAAAFVPPSIFYLQIALFMAVGFTLKMLTPLVAARVMEILPMRKAVPAVAIVIGGGTLFGQFCGPLIVGYLKSISPDFTLSLAALGVSAIIGGVLILVSKTAEERARSRSGLLQQRMTV